MEGQRRDRLRGGSSVNIDGDGDLGLFAPSHLLKKTKGHFLGPLSFICCALGYECSQI